MGPVGPTKPGGQRGETPNEKSLKIIGQDQRRPLAPGGQRGETPNDTHYKTRSPKEMRKSCGLRMLLKLQATPMLSFSSELKNNEKQKLAFGGPGGRAGSGRAHHKISFFRLNPGEIVALRARTQLRTHARTQRNRNRNRNRFPGWQHPPTSNIYTYKTSLKADKEDWGVIFLGISIG